MTREQFLGKKEELKKAAVNLKFLKQEFRKAQSEGRTQDVADLRTETMKQYLVFRSTHIFMSLVRGRTRIQIEKNFETQKSKSYPLHLIEKRILDLCKEFEYEINFDEHNRVIEITKKVEEISKIGA